MIVGGAVLIVLQLIAVFGGFVSGSLQTMLMLDTVRKVGNTIGYFLPGAIGVVLLIVGIRRKKAKRVGEKKQG